MRLFYLYVKHHIKLIIGTTNQSKLLLSKIIVSNMYDGRHLYSINVTCTCSAYKESI